MTYPRYLECMLKLKDVGRTIGPTNGSRELRGTSLDAHRKRALRPGEGCVHGRRDTADRTVRYGHHSTIFLHEIVDLSTDVQVKLLRVLKEQQIERLGNTRSIRVNVRIVAATHRNLMQRIADGTFREDLFYRLNVFPIQVPALRERADDIPQLVWHFVEECSNAFGKRIETITDENMRELQQYAWPGNIRELRNLVERAMILATGPRLSIRVPRATVSSAIRMHEARLRSEGALPERARARRLAHPRRGRRRRATVSPADDARDAHEQARFGTAENSVIEGRAGAGCRRPFSMHAVRVTKQRLAKDKAMRVRHSAPCPLFCLVCHLFLSRLTAFA